MISAIAENSNDSITLTGTAVANSTVTVWSTTGTNDGTATASSSGAWSFTTPVLNSGIYGYYATDTTPGGTSAKSNALGTQVVSEPANAAPAAPVISAGAVNSNDSVTLTGTAPDSATVTVSDGGANPLGTTTASSTGGWSFTTADLSAGAYVFTAADTASAGTSAVSSTLDVTVPAATGAAPGVAEILWQNTDGQAAISEMNGTNVIGGGLVGYNPGPSWQAIGTGDFNDDGQSDILWQNVNTGQASVWELNGTNIIGNELVGGAPGPSWKAIGTGDFNDDGHSDILWQNASTGQASIWEMNGTNVIGGGLVAPLLGRVGKPSEPATSTTTAIPTSCGRTRALAKRRSGK